MTTRASLQSEREALVGLLDWLACNDFPTEARAALTASVARVDALLSLTDDQATEAYRDLCHAATRPRQAHFRTVASLIRRDAPTGPIIEGARGLDAPGGTEP